MNKIKLVTNKMNIMRKFRIVFYLILSSVFYACEQVPSYPRYELGAIEYVPDSLKAEHREYITETIKAASFHMSAGDYEDIDITIRQAKWTADELFEVKGFGLIKRNGQFNYVHIPVCKMSKSEKKIFDSLNNAR